MTKKYISTQEMTSTYPPWAKVRTDDQSTGYQMFNAFAQHMDKMDKSLFTGGKNAFLTTANLDEIDILFKVQLPTTFTFDTDDIDPLIPVSTAPTVTGFIGLSAYPVDTPDSNTVESFWYESVPNRLTVDQYVSGVNHSLLTFTASDAPLDVDLSHHLEGGKIWIQTSGGKNYLQLTNGELKRARIIIRGTTRKGTDESEVLVFPWDMKQSTQKEWKTITKIEVLDMEAVVTVTIRSGDFLNGPYLDAFNLRYADSRRKIDTFWNIGTVVSKSTIDMIQYVSDQWENLAIGLIDRDVIQSWELLDNNLTSVTPVDIAVQPFSERAWVATYSGLLYLYDLSEEMIDSTDKLIGKTFGSHVQFDYDSRYIVRGEQFKFIPWHARPLQEIEKYRIWYQTPTGVKWGLLNGVQTPYSSDFYVRGRQLARTIASKVAVTLDELGEYLFVLEATFIDGTTHTEKVIAKTMFKQPLAKLDISGTVPAVASLDFDADQRLWVRSTGGDYYQVGLHYDLMLLDYDRKIIYLREDYDSVDVGNTQ